MRSSLMLAAVVILGVVGWCAGQEASKTADEIRHEATRPNENEEGRALPLLSHWNSGVHPTAVGWGPDQQMRLIEQGHFLLPWFQHPYFDSTLDPAAGRITIEYYRAALEKCRDLKLPIVFICTEWDIVLSREPFYSLPPEQNPNVIGRDGKVLKQMDPLGPVEPWLQAGRLWTDSALMKELQELYPDPPLVIFLSNNEHPRLRWTEVETSERYVRKYGEGRDDNFKRKVVADGFIERYRALQEGMRQGLVSKAWKTNARFVAYDAFGPPHFGRWGGWKEYSLYVPGRIDPGPLMWDGASTSYYTHNWNPSTDYTVWSPQIEFMNQVFQLDEAYKLNPNFWYELSIWDGYTDGRTVPAEPDDKRKYYQSLGQTYTPERYGAFAQFGMWLLRPRVVREFRMHDQSWEDCKPYFMALAGAVDRVHTNPTLRQWWRTGQLAPNRARRHPYQNDIPAEYAKADRWFLLEADCNPKEKTWESFWTVPVFSLALTRGEAPHREWLVYAHAPLGDHRDVTLTIPSYGTIKVDVSVGGSFYVVDEKARTVAPITD